MGNSIFNLWPKENIASTQDLSKAISVAQGVANELSEIKMVDYKGVAYGETKVNKEYNVECLQTLYINNVYFVLGKDKTVDEAGNRQIILLMSKDRVTWEVIDLNLSYIANVKLHLTYYNSMLYLFIENELINSSEILYCQIDNLNGWINEVNKTEEVVVFNKIKVRSDEGIAPLTVFKINNYNFYKLNEKIIFCVNNNFYWSNDGIVFNQIDFRLYGTFQKKEISATGYRYVDQTYTKSNAILVSQINYENTQYKSSFFGKETNSKNFCRNIIKRISNLCLEKDEQLNGIFMLYEMCYLYHIYYEIFDDDIIFYINVSKINTPIKDNITLYNYLIQQFSSINDVEVEFTKNTTHYFITISKPDKLISLETIDYITWGIYDNDADVGYLPASNIEYISEFRYAGTALYKYYITKNGDLYSSYIMLFGVSVNKKESDGMVDDETASIALNASVYSPDYCLCNDCVCLYYYNKEETEIILTYLITEDSGKVIPTTQYVTNMVKNVSVPSMFESSDESGEIGKLTPEDEENILNMPEGSFICIV